MSEFEEYLTGRIDLAAIHAARDRAVAAGVCLDPPIGCGQLSVVFRDELSFREYQITGLCQVCQDHAEAYYAAQELRDEEGPYYDEPPF